MAHLVSLISVSFMPTICLIVVFYGLITKAPVYDYFIEGAKNGLKTSVEILPYLIGIFLAVNSLTTSGILNLLDGLLSPILGLFSIPSELLPLMLLRAISGSGSFIILQDILEKVGTDSYAGRVACVMTGGCETIIYVLALYFSVTHVKDIRHALKAGLIGYISGILISILLCRFM